MHINWIGKSSELKLHCFCLFDAYSMPKDTYSAVHTVKIKGKISQNFVTFSEYMNFNIWIMYFNITNVPDVFVKDQNLAKTLIGLLKHGFLRNVSNFCSSYLNNVLSKSRKFWVCVDFVETEMWMSSTVFIFMDKIWFKYREASSKSLHFLTQGT